jgi:hypothetical protein
VSNVANAQGLSRVEHGSPSSNLAEHYYDLNGSWVDEIGNNGPS